MAEGLIWSDSWLLGIAMLDDDHRQMVRLINRLLDPAEKTTTTARLDDLITSLRRHFQVEETFLEAIQYPGRAQHRREHRLQLAEFIDLNRKLSTRADGLLVESSFLEIKDWFCNHVVGEDRNVADFYHNVVCNDGEDYRPRHAP